MNKRLLHTAGALALSLTIPGVALSQDPQSPEAVRRQNKQQARGTMTKGGSTSRKARTSPEATSPDPQSPEAVKSTTSKATSSGQGSGVSNARGHRHRGRKRTHKKVQH